jgi:hypothetical protein
MLSMLLLVILTQQIIMIEKLDNQQQSRIKQLQDIITIQHLIKKSALRNGYVGCQIFQNKDFFNKLIYSKYNLENILHIKIISDILGFYYLQPLAYINPDSFVNRKTIILNVKNIAPNDKIYINTCKITEQHLVEHVDKKSQQLLIFLSDDIQKSYQQKGEISNLVQEFYFLSMDNRKHKIFYHVKFTDKKYEIEMLSEKITSMLNDQLHSIIKLIHNHNKEYIINYG